MAAVEDWHIIFLCHCIDGIEETEEVLFGVDVLFTMGTEQNVFALLKSKALVNIAGLDLGEILVQNLSHRRARDVGTLLRESAVCKIAASVLAVGHIHVGNYIHNPAIGLLRQAFVLAAVTGLHVEDRDMQTLGTYHGEAAVGVTKHQYAIGLEGSKELVATVNDVAARRAQVVAHGIHVHLGFSEFEVAEEDAVEVVVVVLACVGQNHVEVLAALVDDGCQADDFGACAHDDAKLQPAVLLPLYVGIICFHFLIYLRGQNRYLGDWG